MTSTVLKWSNFLMKACLVFKKNYIFLLVLNTVYLLINFTESKSWNHLFKTSPWILFFSEQATVLSFLRLIPNGLWDRLNRCPVSRSADCQADTPTFDQYLLPMLQVFNTLGHRAAPEHRPASSMLSCGRVIFSGCFILPAPHIWG